MAASEDVARATSSSSTTTSRLNPFASRKGGQIRFTQEQSSQLEKTFLLQRYLTPAQRRSLANRLALTERQVSFNPSQSYFFVYQKPKEPAAKKKKIF